MVAEIKADDYLFLGNDVRDGVDGWALVDYVWNETNGLGRFEYERFNNDGSTDSYICVRPQPAAPHHTGWYTGSLR